MPPPKPDTSDETDSWDVAKGPRVASRIALVGAGPLSKGLSAACAVGAATALISESVSAIAATAAVLTLLDECILASVLSCLH
jgi:hypothetical protein